MTILDNYDQSSTGTSLECTVFYDTDIARNLFEENFKILQREGGKEHTIAYYVNHGNVPGPDDVSFSIRGEKKDLIAFLQAQGYTTEDFATVDDFAEEVFNYIETPTVLNYQDMNDYDLKDTGLEIVPSKNLERVEVRGYSQGDYAEVILCVADLEEVWGNSVILSELKAEFTKLFYDAPICAVYTINGEEHSMYEFPGWEDYEFKRGEWLAYLSEKTGIAVDVLEKYCPKEPS